MSGQLILIKFQRLLIDNFSGVAQLVEQVTVNHFVGGSSPSSGANFITIIGIPFGIQHLKLAGISLSPVGKTIVTKEVAEAARKANANKTVEDFRETA